MKTDLQIAQSAALKPIDEIAGKLNIAPEHIVHYGPYKAKIKLEARKKKRKGRSKYIDVTAITPTPLGEGKTTTTVGLAQGLAAIGKDAVCAIRQPSMGPTFGIKGGAAGGGYSQIIPMEDFNLHLTGDIHAVAAAHNLAAAAIDSRIYHEGRWSPNFLEKKGVQPLNIDPYTLNWNRVVDINDRSLRQIISGLGSMLDGPIRQNSFDITVASELMAILALSTSLKDMRERIGRIVIGFDKKKNPITTEDLGVAGAMTVLMKDALMPNLLQTLEGQPAFVHAGPFANIAHGNSSVIADQIACSLTDYVVTESGFGADIGMEKFFNIKCRVSGLEPDAVVIVATVRALKMHGGGPSVVPGRPLDPAYKNENLDLVKTGLDNLRAHIRIARKFGVPVVVAINTFPTDTDKEHGLIIDAARKAGAVDAVVSNHWGEGGKGAVALAEAVVKAAEQPSRFEYLYSHDISIRSKIEILAKEIYGASGVKFSTEAEEKIDLFSKLGYDQFPICMAKTHLSISHDPSLKNAPSGFIFPVEDIRASVGAGFLYPLAGDIRTMPGLPSRPAFMDVDIDTETGRVTGLF